jgi:hypothetical protein
LNWRFTAALLKRTAPGGTTTIAGEGAGSANVADDVSDVKDAASSWLLFLLNARLLHRQPANTSIEKTTRIGTTIAAARPPVDNESWFARRWSGNEVREGSNVVVFSSWMVIVVLCRMGIGT